MRQISNANQTNGTTIKKQWAISPQRIPTLWQQRVNIFLQASFREEVLLGGTCRFSLPSFPLLKSLGLKKKKKNWKVALPRRQKAWIHSQASFVKSPCTVFGLVLDPCPAKRQRFDQSSMAFSVTKSRERSLSATERFSDFFPWSKLGHIYHRQQFAVCRQSMKPCNLISPEFLLFTINYRGSN